MKYVLKGLELVIIPLIYLLGIFVPKDNSIWVFGAWMGKRYADNSRALYENPHLEQKKIRAVWIYKESLAQEPLKESYFYLSPKGIYFQLRAKVCFVSHSVRADLFFPCFLDAYKVNLYHGIPIKKILFDVKQSRMKRLARTILQHMLPGWEPVYDLVTSTSSQVTRVFQSAFDFTAREVSETGFPRHEVIKSSLNLSSVAKDIDCLYLPTLRESRAFESKLFWDVGFKEFCEENKKLNISIRLHPANTISGELKAFLKAYSNIEIDDGRQEVSELISRAKNVVVDYSSLYLDYLQANVRFIFAQFDYEDYLQRERDVYFSTSEVTWGEICRNWREVSLQLSSLPSTEEKAVREKVAHRFLGEFNDGQSPSKRIVDYVCADVKP